MGFADIIEKFRERNRNRKEMMKEVEDRVRIEELVMEKKKSANERELNRFLNEHREESIKEQLDTLRKERQFDIAHNHNPLRVKNITNQTEWEVLKERNLFKGKSNMFSNGSSILKNNDKLLKGGMKLIR
jgi:hypothetical protein